MSSSVLYQRLGELTAASLVEHDDDGYRLTSTGRDLGSAIAPLDRWAETWAREST